MKGMGKGFTSFVKNLMDLRGLGIVVLGLGLPTMANAVYSRFSDKLTSIPVLGTVLSNNWGRAGAGILVASGIAYAASAAGLISGTEAHAAGLVASGLFLMGALSNSGVGPDWLRDAIPGSDLSGGYSGRYINGYSGGYLGYLGNADEAMPLDNAQAPMLYGVGSAAPKINIF
jgi:hypothetical protein